MIRKILLHRPRSFRKPNAIYLLAAKKKRRVHGCLSMSTEIGRSKAWDNAGRIRVAQETRFLGLYHSSTGVLARIVQI